VVARPNRALVFKKHYKKALSNTFTDIASNAELILVSQCIIRVKASYINVAQVRGSFWSGGYQNHHFKAPPAADTVIWTLPRVYMQSRF
jgi:uncharacterized membrane protein